MAALLGEGQPRRSDSYGEKSYCEPVQQEPARENSKRSSFRMWARTIYFIVQYYISQRWAKLKEINTLAD